MPVHSDKQYRRKAITQRTAILWITMVGFALNIGIFLMFLANLIHHW